MTTQDTKEPTVMQELFLEALFGVAKGDPMKAKKLAGYGDTVGLRTVMKGLSKVLTEEVSSYITLHAVKAAQGLIDSIDDPTAPGTSNKLAAANSVLDRAGVVKKDKLEVTLEAPTALLIMPPKSERPTQ